MVEAFATSSGVDLTPVEDSPDRDADETETPEETEEVTEEAI
jgi:hypothetical protein